MNKNEEMNPPQNIENINHDQDPQQNHIKVNITKVAIEEPSDSIKLESNMGDVEAKENKENQNPNEAHQENKEAQEIPEQNNINQIINPNTENNNQENNEQPIINEENKDINAPIEEKKEEEPNIENNNLEENADVNKIPDPLENNNESQAINLNEIINEENKEEIKEEQKEEEKKEEEKKEEEIKEPEKKKFVRKERYLIHAVQNYIIRNNFQKLIKVSLQMDCDFNENNKNEKFLKLIRERCGLEKFLSLIVKSQRGLQRYFIKKRKPQKENNRKNYLNQLSNINSMSSNGITMNNDNTTTYMASNYNNIGNTIANNSLNMMNGYDINSTFNSYTKEERSMSRETSSKYKPRITYDDLNKEITDILNNSNNLASTPIRSPMSYAPPAKDDMDDIILTSPKTTSINSSLKNNLMPKNGVKNSKNSTPKKIEICPKR